ncbi:hypothetical protein JCM3765_006031 [Sporobolomyces pararoseus]
MSLQHSDAKPMALDLAMTCAHLTERLSNSWQGNDAQIIFSGLAGAILWNVAVVGIPGQIELSRRLNEELQTFFVTERHPETIHVEGTIYGCSEDRRLEMLRTLVDSRSLELPKTWPFVYRHTFKAEDFQEGQPVEFQVAINCAISFHDPRAPIPPATKLRLNPMPAVPNRVVVATVNPAPILLKAFDRLQHNHGSDILLHPKDQDEDVDAVVLLAMLLRAINDPGSSSARCKDGFPFAEDTFAQLLNTKDYVNTKHWLRSVVERMERYPTSSRRSRRYEESADLNLKVELYLPAFQYLAMIFNEHTHKRLQKNLGFTQNEDQIQIPFYPVAPHEPVPRRHSCHSH